MQSRNKPYTIQSIYNEPSQPERPVEAPKAATSSDLGTDINRQKIDINNNISDSINPNYKFTSANEINKGELFNIYNNGGVATARSCRNYIDQELIDYADFSEVFRDTVNNRIFVLTTDHKLIHVDFSGAYCVMGTAFDLPAYTGTFCQAKMDEVTGRVFIVSYSGGDPVDMHLTSFTISTVDNATITSLMASVALPLAQSVGGSPDLVLFNVYNGALGFAYKKALVNELYGDGGYYSTTTYTHGASTLLDSDGATLSSILQTFSINKNISASTQSHFVVTYQKSLAATKHVTIFKVGYTDGAITDLGTKDFGTGVSAIANVEKSRNRICIFYNGSGDGDLYGNVYDNAGTQVTSTKIYDGTAVIPYTACYNDTTGNIFLVAKEAADTYIKSRKITINSSDVLAQDATTYDLEYFVGGANSQASIASPAIIYDGAINKMFYVSKITYATLSKVIVTQSLSNASWGIRDIIDTATVKPMFIAQNDALISGDYVYGIPILVEKVDNSIVRLPASAFYFDKFSGALTSTPEDPGQATLLGYSFNTDYLLLTVNYYDL